MDSRIQKQLIGGLICKKKKKKSTMKICLVRYKYTNSHEISSDFTFMIHTHHQKIVLDCFD